MTATDSNGREIRVGDTVRHPERLLPMKVLEIRGRSVITDDRSKGKLGVRRRYQLSPVFLASKCTVAEGCAASAVEIAQRVGPDESPTLHLVPPPPDGAA